MDLEGFDLRVRIRDRRVLAGAQVGHGIDRTVAEQRWIDVAVVHLHCAVEHQILELLASIDQLDLRLPERLGVVLLEYQEEHRVPVQRVFVLLDAQEQLLPASEREEALARVRVVGDDLVAGGVHPALLVRVGVRLLLTRRSDRPRLQQPA